MLMNNKAEELGLKNTHFVTPHGLDSEGHQTTAYELAQLANYALENKKFKEIVGTKSCTVTVSGKSVTISNGNELLGNFLGVYGVKTGFTNGANRCLVTACERSGIDVISVVLGADTKNIRTVDSKNILNYTFQNFQYVDIESQINKYFQEWKADNFIEVEKGNTLYADIKIENIEYSQILIKKNNIDKIKVKVECEKLLKAPVFANTKVGEIIVKLEEEEILKSNIVIENTVDKKATEEYFCEIMKNFKKYLLESFV